MKRILFFLFLFCSPILANPELVLQSGPVGEQHYAALSSDGRYLALSAGGKTQIWDVEAEELRRVLRGGGPVAWSKDGALLAVGGEGLREWNMPGGSLRFYNRRGGGRVAFSGDGSRLICGDNTQWSAGEALIFDSQTGKMVQRLKEGDFGSSYWYGSARPILSSDGKLALTFNSQNYSSSEKNEEQARLWDVETGKVKNIFEARKGVRCAAFSPDGAWLALGQEENTLTLLNVTDGREKRLLNGPSAASYSIQALDGVQLPMASFCCLRATTKPCASGKCRPANWCAKLRCRAKSAPGF